MHRRYVAVGFKVDVENSIWYRKFDSKKSLLRFLYEHLDEVDFVSLRIVKKEVVENGSVENI